MPPDRPNVLLLVSDQHNYRFFGHRDDGEPVRTPALDGLAGAGTVLERTYCAVPLCGPSRLTFLTGREARRAGGWQNYCPLKAELPTVASALSASGYATCLQGKMHLAGDRQFAGFDERPYGDLTGMGGHQPDPPAAGLEAGMRGRGRILDTGVTGIPESHLQETNTAAETVAWIREHRAAAPETPWFLTASFSRPHWPRTAPRRHVDRYREAGVPAPRVGLTPADDHPYVRAVRDRYGLDDVEPDDETRARAAYFACVEFLDEVVGDLLGTLDREGALEDTVVVYVSDHGELAGEHGLWEKRTWHESSTRVPWIVQLPEHRRGDVPAATVETPVSLVDLLPTVCGLTGAAVPDGVDGVDLSTAVRTGREPDRGVVFCDYLDPAVDGLRYRVAVDATTKYVRFHDAPDRLYDLEADPLEREDRSGEPGSVDGGERLAALAAESLDFAAAAEAAARDLRLKDAHRLGVPRGTGNAYTLPDGRIVDADAVLYHPHVLVEEPEVVFEDHP